MAPLAESRTPRRRRHQHFARLVRVPDMDLVITGCVAGETPNAEARLERLFDAYHPRLYRLARRMTATPDDALDLVQDTFVRAATALGRVPQGAPAEEAWLVRVLVNLQRDAWRRAKVRTDHAAHGRRSEAGPDPEGRLVAAATIWRAVTALPPRRRAIVVLHELEDLPVARIAALLGITSVTVRWHLFRGRGELARVLGVEGSTR